MDDTDHTLTVADALQNIYNTLVPLTEFETVAIKDALYRVLAKDIVSPLNIPPANNSAMDGYALKSSDIPVKGTARIKVIGTAFAGKPLQKKVSQGQCVRIMTGAVVPDSTDTVVIQEHTESVDDDTILIDSSTHPGANVRQAGEDIAVNDTALEKGRRLTAADLGLIASLGIGEVAVIRKLRVAFFSTGDELCSINKRLQAGQIYDSNRYTLFGMLNAFNIKIIDMGVITDQRQQLQQAFASAEQKADVIITTGGVSVGEADFVKEVLQEHGLINFWKVAMKPGRPLVFGKIGNAFFFGLPGNPVSVMVTFYQFVRPALRVLMGEKRSEAFTMQVPSTSRLKKRPGRTEYQRGVLKRDKDQQWVVKKTGAQGSGILSSMSQANCFIILPTESTVIEPGTMVEVQPFSGYLTDP